MLWERGSEGSKSYSEHLRQGPAPGYAAFLDVVKATDDWGLEADIMQFRALDKCVITYKAQLDCTHGELKSTIIARDQC